jgi:hypothetical protein
MGGSTVVAHHWRSQKLFFRTLVKIDQKPFFRKESFSNNFFISDAIKTLTIKLFRKKFNQK